MPSQEPQILGTNRGQQEQIDPTALTLSRAIRSAEATGYDQKVQEPNATTSFGAYGWNGDNFKNWATQYKLDPNDTSETNQDHLAYLRIKDMLDQGKSQSEIAAIWNGANIQNGKITANNPAYVDRVKSYYEQHAQRGNFVSPPSLVIQPEQSIQPVQPTTQEQVQSKEPGFGEKLSGRLEDISGALSGKTSSNVISGALQTGGAIAGGLGDIVGAGLNVLSFGIFNKIQDAIGQGIGELAKTETGQAVVKSIKDFSDKNPELAKDVGATINIVSAIPILKGLGAVKGAVLDAASSALKPIATNVFDNTLTTVAKSAGKSGVRFMESNPGIFKEAAERGLIPEIENVGGINKYRTGKLIDDSWERIRDLNTDVQDALKATQRKLVPPTAEGFEQSGAKIIDDVVNGFTDKNGRMIEGFPESNFTRADILKTGRELTPQYGRLWDKFELGQASPVDINKLRVGLDNAVESVYSKMSSPPINKDIGKTLADSMRNYIQTTVPETQNLFAEMSKQFDLQKAFSFIENKSIKSGLIGGTVKNLATGLGEVAGNATGVPFAGALIGRGMGGTVGKRLTGGVEGILKRTIPGAAKIGLREGLTGAGKVIGGLTAQRFGGQTIQGR